MSTDPFLELWKAATEKYEKETVNVQNHPLASCDIPDAVLDALDHKLRNFEEYREKKEKLRQWLKPMLHLIGSLSATAGEAVGVPVPFAKAGFVALGVLVQAAEDVSARYDCIINLCELLHSFLERLRVYMSAQLLDGMREVVIRILVHLLSVFALVTKEIKHARLVSYFRVLIGKTEIRDALEKLDNLIRAEQSMGIASTMLFSQTILDRVHDLVLVAEVSTDTLAQLQNDLQKAIQSTEGCGGAAQQPSNFYDLPEGSNSTTIVRAWLNAPDPRINHNSARFLHDGNTGNWLLRSFEYKSWKTTSSSFFWLYGKSGAGKTIICSTVIEDLQANFGGALAYFYFYHGEKGDLRGMLSSMITQLEKQYTTGPSPLDALHKKLTGLQPSLLELIDVLKSLIHALSDRPIFIVLDALDEYSKPNELELFFCSLLQPAEDHVHIFVTSRVEDDVTRILLPLTTFKLDLSSVVKAISILEAKDRDLVLDYLVEHSNGMFQWVTCQLDELSKCLPRDLQITLNRLPPTLEETYDQILSRISIANKPHARRLFSWLAYSFRPLHVKELAQVLAVDFTTDANATFREDYIVLDPGKVISQVCLSLIHITPDNTVQFAHVSVKEYLISERIQSTSSSQFKVEEEIAHTIITASCLAYLLWVGNRDNIPKKTRKIRHQYPLASYSLQYAVVHPQADHVCDNVLAMLLSLFTEDSPQWAFWASHSSQAFDITFMENAPPLYLAATYGLFPLLLQLLKQGVDVNNHGGRYENALSAAAFHGYPEIVQLLLEHGADLNAPAGVLSAPPLHVACSEGHLRIVPNSAGHLTIGPNSSRHLEIVELLLDKGADANAQGNHYGTAFQVAAFNTTPGFVQLLLDGVASDGDRQRQLQQYPEWPTALEAALYGGHIDMAWLLIDWGVDMSAEGTMHTDPDWPTALQAALYGGYAEVAQELINNGADVNAQYGEYPTALQSALYSGYIDIVELLLAKEADVNAQGGECPTVLQIALDTGRTDLAQALLKRGADVNAEGKHFHATTTRPALIYPERLSYYGGDGGIGGLIGGDGGAGSFGGFSGRGGRSLGGWSFVHLRHNFPYYHAPSLWTNLELDKQQFGYWATIYQEEVWNFDLFSYHERSKNSIRTEKTVFIVIFFNFLEYWIAKAW
ncbi:hypothetical protein C8F04DRAFT_1297876 [Mycena alexandri]|uniref:NACHT domain-containing protein n=1 Tax=Mycena alexandri TaxID=1745969 RepID=A0AAD6SE10_9AGAR|nr:hypothetical protein C8F04DRAFT_1297876 [Mycena alexandri]